MDGGEKKLNPEQLKAIKHKSGPLLIIAGAGTGKTTVVTERIKHLITAGLAKPPEILALTFTDKAAREMEERVDQIMPYGYTQMWILTFHSFCDRILRRESLAIGLDPKFKLLTQASTIQFIRDHLFEFDLNYFRPLGNPDKFVEALLQHFSRLQDEDIIPKEYLAWSKKIKSEKSKETEEEKQEAAKWQELAQAFEKYDQLKTKAGVMDFADLISKTLLLFRTRKNVLKEYQKQFKYVLVDEFQDTNIAQYELVKLLAPAGSKSNLTTTGDDFQSVYKFRGAAVSNILQFQKDYPKAKTVVLIKNYRSGQEILDAAYQLISHNNPDTLESMLGIDKNLVSVRKLKNESAPEFIHQNRVENEAEAVVKKILELTEKEKYQYQDFAILVRANNHADPFVQALQRHSLPHQFLGPAKLFQQPEVIDLISYLKVLINPDDSTAFYKILSLEHLNIDDRDLLRISNFARRLHLSFFEACERVEEVFVSSQTREKIKKLLEIIKRHLKLTKMESAGQLLYFFLEDFGLLTKMITPDSPEVERRALNISKFFDKLKTFEIDHPEAGIQETVDWIDLCSELGESPLASDVDWTENNAVNLLTIHSAKGLEFPVVFLVNLVSQRFPTIERKEKIPIPEDLIKEVLPVGDFHLQEERRLFYVGMTRAQNRLFLTAADYYGEGKREKKISPFVFEALGDQVLAAEKKVDLGQQLSFLDYGRPKEEEIRELVQEAGRRRIQIDYLSYSQIETFRICPLHYKLRYIYKIPTPPSAALSFGSSIHAALKDFYLSVKNNQRPTEKLILQSLEQNWLREGFKNREHERRALKKAQDHLKVYLRQEFNSKQIPLLLEQPFVVPLQPEKGERGLKIGGKIDRVDQLKGKKIEVIDYKTGANVPTQKDVDHDLQLTFYALATNKIQEEPFNKKPEEIVLSLYYFDNQKKISTTRTQKQLEEARKEIFDYRKQIEESEFNCSGSILCQNCEYSLFCRSEQ